jgi:hypothetical protein
LLMGWAEYRAPGTKWEQRHFGALRRYQELQAAQKHCLIELWQAPPTFPGHSN